MFKTYTQFSQDSHRVAFTWDNLQKRYTQGPRCKLCKISEKQIVISSCPVHISVRKTEPVLPKLTGFTGMKGSAIQMKGLNWKWPILY